MHERDLENWRAIHDGERPATWADFLGHPKAASHLSPDGLNLLPRIAEDLTRWFGRDWLRAVIGPAGEGRISGFGRFSPTLSLRGDRGAASSFIEILRWWAALGSQEQQHGMGKVRRDLRSDVRWGRLIHTLTQTRLGAIASTAGMAVEFERHPGDLLIDDGTTHVTVEVRAMVTSQDLTMKQQVVDDMFAHLDDLGRHHRVHFHGQLPPLVTDRDAWRLRTSEDAAKVARLGVSLSIVWDGAELFVEPGDVAKGGSLDGPAIEVEVGTRLAKHARGKAFQVADAPAGWLWLENFGAVDTLVAVHQLPLAEQLAAYASLFDGWLSEVPSVRGLTFSGSEARPWSPTPSVEQTSLDSVQLPVHDSGDGSKADPARGMLQPLLLDQVRTTFHLPADGGAEAALMWDLVQQENRWLDLALAALGVPTTAVGLLRMDLRSA